MSNFDLAFDAFRVLDRLAEPSDRRIPEETLRKLFRQVSGTTVYTKTLRDHPGAKELLR